MKTVEETVERYQSMKGQTALFGMYDEVKWQYVNMAKGGDGGDMGFTKNGETTCRGINYKGYPDSFFREVSERMGWLPRKETITLESYSSDPF